MSERMNKTGKRAESLIRKTLAANNEINDLILIIQFVDELQVRSGQVLLNPLIDFLVQLWAKVVLPVTRFAYIPIQFIV